MTFCCDFSVETGFLVGERETVCVAVRAAWRNAVSVLPYSLLLLTLSVKAVDVVTCDGLHCGHTIIDGQKAWQCTTCDLDLCEECTESAGCEGKRISKPSTKRYAVRTCVPVIPMQPLHINSRREF